LRKLGGLRKADLVYVTYHVDVSWFNHSEKEHTSNHTLCFLVQIGQIPFFVAVDHEMKAVIISIRGTLSLQVLRTFLIDYFHSLIELCFLGCAYWFESWLRAATCRPATRRLARS
jgi:hypothetical protein